MKRLIQLLRMPELSPFLVMNFVFEELCAAFVDDDCRIKIVNHLSELENGGIIFMDNSVYQTQKPLLELIGRLCPESVFILWYWLDTSFKPFSRIIYTGEYNLKVPTNPSLRDRHLTYMSNAAFAPLKLRANEHPSLIGQYKRNVERDYCYMGAAYKRDWIPPQFQGIYHVGGWHEYLSYAERRNIYLSSTFALGFQSEDNIDSGHLSQRLFEGLAYGCIVLCENQLASEFTDGIIVHITSKEDLAEKMMFFKANPQEMTLRQEKGYDWVRKFGTNRVSVQTYTDKITELFGLSFDKLAQQQHQPL